MTFEEELHDALHRDAAQLTVEPPGPDRARRRGHRRTNRARAGVATISACALVAGVVVVAQQRSDDGSEVIVQTPTAKAATPELVWRSAPGFVASDLHHVTSDDGVTYALSTAPGESNPNAMPYPQAIYRSSDGEHWQTAPLAADHQLADLTVDDGVLYAISTAPGSATDAQYKFESSTDGGATWDAKTIPITLTRPASDVELNEAVRLHVARKGAASVVVATVSYAPNYYTRLNELMGREVSSRETPQGVEVLDTANCDAMKASVEGTVVAADTPINLSESAEGRAFREVCADPKVLEVKPWSAFGITHPEQLRSQQAFTSSNGTDWTATTLPMGANAAVAGISATTDGFLAAVQSAGAYNDGPLEAWSSTDGVTWTKRSSAPVNVSDAEVDGDRIVGTSWDRRSSVVTSNDGGLSWSVTDVGAGRAALASDSGPLGFAIVVTDELTGEVADRDDVVWHSTDGVTWKQYPAGALGAPKGGYPAAVRVGRDAIEVTYSIFVPDGNGNGKERLTALLGTPKA